MGNVEGKGLRRGVLPPRAGRPAIEVSKPVAKGRGVDGSLIPPSW